VDTPHDFVAERGNFSQSADNHLGSHGFLQRNVSWYRKHFRLAEAWEGGTTWVHFEGVFHHATIFLNGKYLMQHECGYTEFSVRLDNSTAIRYGTGAANTNVLAVRVDATFGSGHWYEGGGIHRPVHLVHLTPLHFVLNGVFAPSETDGSIIHASAEIEDTRLYTARGGGNVAVNGAVVVKFTLFSSAGVAIASNKTAPATITTAATVTLACTLHPPPGSVEHWSLHTPTLYTLRAELFSDAESILPGDRRSTPTATASVAATPTTGRTAAAAIKAPTAIVAPAAVDAVNVTVGFRTTR
jgi:beta-galactosidase/beta-glucuronidase